MQVVVRGKNIEVTDALRQYAEKKLRRLERFFSVPLQAQVTLRVEKGEHVVEVTVPLNGMILRAEEARPDMYASIDLVIDKLERQVRKFKTRINRKARRAGTDERKAALVVTDDGDEPEQEGRVVRTKRFAIKPMDVEEAILQMNLLGHDFFVFRNMTSGEVNVVYRRHDGNYGLIEPEA